MSDPVPSWPAFLKTRFYPVDVDTNKVYLDPHPTAQSVVADPRYKGRSVTGVSGQRLNTSRVLRVYLQVVSEAELQEEK